MTTSETASNKPLWLSIEEGILALDSQGLAPENLEASIQQVAGDLDNAGYNVSRHGGNMLDLRMAMTAASKVGRPFMQDFNTAIDALTLEDLEDLYAASNKLINNIAETWPGVKKADHRTDVLEIMEQTRLNLMVAKANNMPDDQGIRYLIEEQIEAEVIISSLEITDEKLAEVNAQIEAERAERARVASLLKKVEGKPADEIVRHLIDNNVAEDLIIEMGQVDQGAIDGVKQAMEEELKEKQRLAEEEAARKKKEAEGPALEDISSDDMIDYIDSIREIMEFSDQEKEIRVMCEQSSIPKALVDIAVSDPDKLDELEKQAEG
jgi:hypothetical protein